MSTRMLCSANCMRPLKISGDSLGVVEKAERYSASHLILRVVGNTQYDRYIER